MKNKTITSVSLNPLKVYTYEGFEGNTKNDLSLNPLTIVKVEGSEGNLFGG